MALEEKVSDSIGVIGAGYVGLVSGACFSFMGFNVGIVEVDRNKIDRLSRGESTIYEPGLSEILEESIASKRLSFYPTSKDLFSSNNCDIIFVAVGTPERADGSCNMDYVFSAVKDVVESAKQDLVLVIKSTVPVGTSRKIKEYVQSLSPNFRIGVVNNPEFLKEGSAVSDFLKPERVVLGGTEGWALDKVKALYESLLHNGHPLFVTDHESAELGKLASNLVLASRISLINQVSRLAHSAGADIKQVESSLRIDIRIGSKYLYAGLGYGGSCFPKDVKSFIHQCKERNIDTTMAEAVDNFNESQKLFFLEPIKKRFKDPASTTISILGVAFKPETDDIRESPALNLTIELKKLGFKLKVYDPKALNSYRNWLEENKVSGVSICASTAEALKDSDALVLVTEWQEFQRLGSARLKTLFAGKVIYDGKNVFKPDQIQSAGYEYLGIGRAPKN